MRAIGAAILAAGAALSANAVAQPNAADSYELKTVSVPGAIFSGVSRDGDFLLLTNLADGRLYRRSEDGTMAAFGPTLPHGLDVIGEPTGPYRVVRYGENYLVAQGWAPVDAQEGPSDHALIEVDETGIVRTLSSDFWNPFSLVVSGNTIIVVDAAKNSIERLSGSGEKTTLLSFPRVVASGAGMQSLSPTQFSTDAHYEIDAVPTGIALNDGRINVSLFGGFPFLASGGTVVSFPETGGEMQVDVSGLDAPVDLAWKGAQILILEHGTFDQATGFEPGSGRLIAFDDMHGDGKVLLEGLTRPTSVLVWDDDEIIVSDLNGNLYFLKTKTAE